MPGDLIDEYFGDKNIGTRMIYKHEIEGIVFFINWQKDNAYVTKRMSTHGTVSEVQGHAIFQLMSGKQITSCCLELHHQDSFHSPCLLAII